MPNVMKSKAIKKNTGLTIAAGIVILLMGLFAMGSPLVAGTSLTVMVGVMLIIGGISQLMFGIAARGAVNKLV
jgi:uncharacterized membrane protein HdeD (DUF308 family)